MKALLLIAGTILGWNCCGEIADAALKSPFWQGDTVHGESLLFVKAGDGSATAKCLFSPDTIIELKSTSQNIVYVPGKDYQLQAGSNTIILPAGSRIDSLRNEELFPPVGAKNCIKYKKGDKTRGVLFLRKNGFLKLQVEITYKHHHKWSGPMPQFVGEKLPLFYAKLQKHETARVTILGDSITAGYNASKTVNTLPFQPDWKVLWQQAMMKKFKTPIVRNGLAVPGRTSGWMLLHLDKQLETRPDLVIVAFGMNDYNAYKNAAIFKQKIQAIMAKFRGKQPECEFLLISPMLGNPDWSNTPWPLAFAYLKALRELETQGVVVADLTSLWRDMLKTKSYVSQTGNGVNHPNDFGHRIYAKYLLEMFISRNKE